MPMTFGVIGAFFVVDLSFFSANSLKIIEGGWFPAGRRGRVHIDVDVGAAGNCLSLALLPRPTDFCPQLRMDHEQRAVFAVARRARSTDYLSAPAPTAAGNRISRAVQRRAAESLPPPVPAEALDDRIAILGTAGSGKTYAAKGFVERLLDSGARVTIVDPLGVW
jgi:Helicase HerA, central domain